MKIYSARVDFNHEYANDPKLYFTMDRVPRINEYRYKKISISDESTAYFAVIDPFVSFFIHQAKDERGYGGRMFELTLTDGSIDHVRGLWSSSSGYMNDRPWAIPSTEVIIKEHGSHTHYASNLTLHFIREFMQDYFPKIGWEISDTPSGLRFIIEKVDEHDKRLQNGSIGVEFPEGKVYL